MIIKTVEFENFAPQSNNWVKAVNHHVEKRYKLDFKKRILLLMGGEGPWPKCNIDLSYPEHVRKEVTRQMREKWMPRHMVFADVTVRRERRFDKDNYHGGMKPLWDCFVKMGWMVDDHVKWFDWVLRPQALGDPKLIITFYVGESKEDDLAIQEMSRNGGRR